MSRPAACAEEAAERLRAGRMSDTTPLGWIAQRLPLRRGALPLSMRLGPPGGGLPRGQRTTAFRRRQLRSRERCAGSCRRRVCGAAGAPLLARGSLGAVSDARGGVMSELLLDAAGRRRSPATMPEFHAGRPPRNKGVRYPVDPPTIEEIVAVMGRAGDSIHGWRVRGLIVVLWRAGLRIHEALALAEADLDPRRGWLLVRRGKGARRRGASVGGGAW